MLVPGAGVEPARLIQPLDFKSNASTNSAIRAKVRSAGEGDRTPDYSLEGSYFTTKLLPLGYFLNNFF